MGTTPAKLNWSNFTVTGGIALPSFSSDLTNSIDLGLSGDVGLNVLSGLLVARSTFAVTMGQVSGNDGSLAGSTTLTDAQAMTVELSNVGLWVGLGGSLDNTANNDVNVPGTFDDDAVANGTLGFRGNVTSLKLVTLKDTKATPLDAADDVSYMGLEIDGLVASLIGLESLLEFNAWNINV